MKALRLPLDIISTLPQAIIETILCLLPIEEAARTSILSRDWRNKWTTIPKLMFLESTVSKTTNLSDLEQTSHIAWGKKNMDMRCKLFNAIHQVLLLRQGPIHEFSLSMVADRTCLEIDQIILHLSGNHAVRKLTLDLTEPYDTGSYNLPLSVFSLHHLTDLYLSFCDFNHQPIFMKTGSLTSLSLDAVRISRESLLHILSNSPSLKSLRLLMLHEDFFSDEKPNIKLKGSRDKDSGEILVKYSDVWLEHLNELEIEYFRYSELEMDFVKFMLVRSPNMKKVILRLFMVNENEELKMLKILSRVNADDDSGAGADAVDDSDAD